MIGYTLENNWGEFYSMIRAKIVVLMKHTTEEPLVTSNYMQFHEVNRLIY